MGEDKLSAQRRGRSREVGERVKGGGAWLRSLRQVAALYTHFSPNSSPGQSRRGAQLAEERRPSKNLSGNPPAPRLHGPDGPGRGQQ